jgi:hypothetical protein
MSKRNECPYCGGRAVRVSGRVARQPSHLAFGYGERKHRCSRCAEIFSVCYAIPPKFTSGYFEKKHPGILRVTFREGVGGFADPVVLTAQAPGFAETPKAEDAGQAESGSQKAVSE